MKIFLAIKVLLLVSGFSSASKSEEACKSFGKLPTINVNQDLESFKAQHGEFPEAVALEYKIKDSNETRWSCNGVLISEKFVITAAHCVVDPDNRPFSVRLGVVRKILLFKI